ncbi:Ldh family oxidoreductase [Ornithinimicrobium murale]|uniref:Ldh family oxidoreductase n=1 Tax=Ornithinimicrobium murale TaxID=1050153 RepID=UPI000E0D7617|nr:Ldh family oxidoreductase [Ornithinimicrobium murale]
MIVNEADELELVSKVLLAHGAPSPAAKIQARVLVEGDLRGQQSHGLQRLPVLVERITNGVIDAAAVPVEKWVSESYLDVDGARGLGPVVAFHVVDQLIERASKVGLAVGSVRNNNHVGMLACYVERVAYAGHIGLAFTTSEALVHPSGGRTAMVGTNPIGVGVPTDGEPFVLDMATGAASRGKILAFARDGKPLGQGWAIDAEGAPTMDAELAVDGAISPFGGPKGYALGLALELVVAGLTGSETGQRVLGTLDARAVCNKGDLFVVFSPDALGLGGVASRMGTYLDEVRNSPLAEGFTSIDVPGDRARRTRAERIAHGIPIPDAVWKAAEELLP